MDLNNDGYDDILSGQYNPGLISWWKGSKNGFLPREFVPQQGIRKDRRYSHYVEPWSPNSSNYWNYTSTGFADFNNDGLYDLFVGGSGGLRVALNIGTKSQPKFGLRKYLLGLDGEPLSVKKDNKSLVKAQRKKGLYPNPAGSFKTKITPVDWDNDGVLDLIVTNGYVYEGTNPVDFFKGVRTDKGLRFIERQSLITRDEDNKCFPGCFVHVSVCDYNSDGINDILMGLSLPIIKGEGYDENLSFKYLHSVHLSGPGKDIGLYTWENGVKKIEEDIKVKPYKRKHCLGSLKDEKYLLMRHMGYVYVLLGSKNKTIAINKKVVAKEAVKLKVIPNVVERRKKSGYFF